MDIDKIFLAFCIVSSVIMVLALNGILWGEKMILIDLIKVLEDNQKILVEYNGEIVYFGNCQYIEDVFYNYVVEFVTLEENKSLFIEIY